MRVYVRVYVCAVCAVLCLLACFAGACACAPNLSVSKPRYLAVTDVISLHSQQLPGVAKGPYLLSQPKCWLPGLGVDINLSTNRVLGQVQHRTVLFATYL